MSRQAVTRFAGALERFADTLSDSERDLLLRLIVADAEPLERIRHLALPDLLSPDEVALVDELSAMKRGSA